VSVSVVRLPLAVRALPADVVTAARARDVADETLGLVDEVSAWVPGLEAGDRTALGLLVLALQEARASGSTRLALAGAPPPALAALFGRPGDYKPFIVDDGDRASGAYLYAHRDWTLEDRLAQRLAAHVRDAPAAFSTATLEGALTQAAPADRPFDREQQGALRAALERPLTVITGGPGTGKTALLVGIVRALRALGLASHEIALAAPTGRAANRIAESLRTGLPEGEAPEPRTLHRLLGYRGGHVAGRAGEYRHHENYPLPHRAVLVDEASMIDLELMERLARAVAPGTRLVLLGDADQLPSVAAGAVFRELGALAIRLVGSHRQDPSAPAGASVLAAARAVLAGDAGALGGPVHARPEALAWSGFERLAPAGAATAADRRLVAAFADAWIRARVLSLPGYAALVSRTYRLLAREDGAAGDGAFHADDAVALGTLLAHHRGLRVLAVTRDAGAATSAESLNLTLARRAAAALDDAAPVDGAAPAPGTPVLMIRNDYDRGLFNGDQGVVVRAATVGGSRLVVVFPRGAGLSALPYDSLQADVRVAYATTVHKAQGAELDHVALVLPERDLPLLSRELVYTALTRARQSAVVVGRHELLAAAIARPLERASGLAARLAAATAATKV
jgi:exodeoxyribonuclease V alpha subunit